MNSTYSLVQEVTVCMGEGNLVADPLFIDPENCFSSTKPNLLFLFMLNFHASLETMKKIKF